MFGGGGGFGPSRMLGGRRERQYGVISWCRLSPCMTGHHDIVPSRSTPAAPPWQDARLLYGDSSLNCRPYDPEHP
jgi:hypothetical protein